MTSAYRRLRARLILLPVTSSILVLLTPFAGEIGHANAINLSAMTDTTGFGLTVGYGKIGERTSVGVGGVYQFITTYGAETRSRGLAHGKFSLQVAVEVWGLRPGDLVMIDATALWLPDVAGDRLRPYIGFGGGAGNLFESEAHGLSAMGPQGKISLISGITYLGGWDDGAHGESLLTSWFIELRAGYYMGSISETEIVLRQGILWLRM